jgi:SH3-like domain-containing protein
VPRRLNLLLLVIAVLVVPPAAHGADKSAATPRFASLRATEVNLRTGPGDRYPIEWVFTRKGLPVEILDEFEHWRKVRASDGTEGWVHQRMLTGKRSVLVVGEVRALHSDPDAGSAVVARAEPGVVATLMECRHEWCRIAAGDVTGWLRESEIWGVFPNEVVQ